MLDDWGFIYHPGNVADVPLKDILLKPYHGFFRPFAFLVLRVAVSVFGSAPALYHIVNFLLYYVICRMVFGIIRDLSGRPDLALLAAALYTVHPVHHPLVANCFTLCLNIFIICGLGSIRSFIRYLDRRRKFDARVSLGLFAAAALSHLAAVMIPLYMLIIARFRIKVTVRDLLKDLWPFAAALAVIVAIRIWLPEGRSLTSLFTLNISPLHYLAALWDLLCWYHAQFIFPLRTIFLWDIPIAPRLAALKSFNLLISAAGIIYLLAVRWRMTQKGTWLALHTAGLLPVGLAAFIYSPQTQTAIIEPLWFGVSSIGIYALAANGLMALKGKIPAKSFSGLIVGVIVALILLTLGHNAKWRNERIFCRYWIEVNPLNQVPWARWAGSYVGTGETTRLLEELASMEPRLQRRGSPLAWTNRGHVYNRLGQFDAAISDYSAALALSPDHIDALLSRANCYAISDRLAEAEEDLQRILAVDPQHAAAKADLKRLREYRRIISSSEKQAVIKQMPK